MNVVQSNFITDTEGDIESVRITGVEFRKNVRDFFPQNIKYWGVRITKAGVRIKAGLLYCTGILRLDVM